MKDVFYFVAFLLAVMVIAVFDTEHRQPDLLPAPVAPENSEKALLLKRAEQAAQSVPVDLQLSVNQKGYVVTLPEHSVITEQGVQQVIDKQTRFPGESSYIMLWGDPNSYTYEKRDKKVMTAMGTDLQHHFVSSYLVGVQPFDAENNWLPFYTLAARKSYQLDQEQYGLREVWQNSAQAYINLRGDCEDHAILLADWLISEGIDARVVGGKYKDGGHAWVVAFTEQGEFLLEATSKSAPKSWKHYPLASLSNHYHPEFMFNRDTFWINQGSKLTKDYAGEHWQQTAKFFKGSHD